MKRIISKIGIQSGARTQSQPIFIRLVNLKKARQAEIKIKNVIQPLNDIFCNGIVFKV